MNNQKIRAILAKFAQLSESEGIDSPTFKTLHEIMSLLTYGIHQKVDLWCSHFNCTDDSYYVRNKKAYLEFIEDLEKNWGKFS